MQARRGRRHEIDPIYESSREPLRHITMLKGAFVAAGTLAVAVLATMPTQPAAAAICKAGYAPVKIQGNYVCRLQTPNLPLKAKTQGKKAHGSVWSPHWETTSGR